MCHVGLLVIWVHTIMCAVHLISLKELVQVSFMRSTLEHSGLYALQTLNIMYSNKEPKRGYAEMLYRLIII